MIDVRICAYWMERACGALGFLLGCQHHDVEDRRQNFALRTERACRVLA
jgi:hypothetical protein